jgi:uncharacterized protein (AIM24 family)
MRHEVTSGAYPLLRIFLAARESLDAEVRALVSIVGPVEVQSVPLSPLKKNVKSAIAGKKDLVTNRFTASGDAEVTLTAGLAGELLTLHVTPEAGLLASPGAYVASGAGVTLDIELWRLGRAYRVPLLSFDGEGALFLGASGAVHTTTLGASETMTVDRVHLLACDDGLGVQDVSERGLMPAVTGQDLIELTGPGRVFLQSLPRTVRASPLATAVKVIGSLL